MAVLKLDTNVLVSCLKKLTKKRLQLFKSSRDLYSKIIVCYRTLSVRMNTFNGLLQERNPL